MEQRLEDIKYEDFYSTLNQKNIPLQDFELFKQNWKDFKCQNLKDYTMKYLKLDVLILIIMLILELKSITRIYFIIL